MSKKLFILISFIFVSFTSVAEVESKKREHLIVEEYNKKFQTVQDLIHYVQKIDSKKSEHLKTYFLSQHMSLDSKIPGITMDKEFVTFTDKNLKDMKMKIEKHHVLLFAHGKKASITLADSTEETIKTIEKLMTTPEKVSVLNLFISSAMAEGYGEAMGIAASGAYASGAFALLGAMDSIGRFFKDIASIPGDLSERSIRNEANEACEDIQKNKPVKNADKIISKLEKLKVKVDCVPYWESMMENSCGWFDERIQCLSQGSLEVSDKGRGKVKDVPVDTNKSETTKSSVKAE